jgi:glycosyltransferase involved in cell wall biosynthesis
VNVLWVTPAFPDAKGAGGRVHEYELLRSVAPRHQITVLSSSWEISAEALAAVRALGVGVRVVPWLPSIRPRTRLRRLMGLLLGAGPTSIVSTFERRLKPIAEAIRAEVAERPVDVVVVFLGDLAPVAGASPAPTALMLFDIYARQTELMERGLTKRAIRFRLERRNAARWEAKHYRRAEGVACVSPIDAEIAAKMIGRPVDLVPNPIPDEFFAEPAVPRSPATVTFVGGFGWEPNVDSARWLVREIWPRIKERRPDARLRIAGRGAFYQLRKEVEDAGGEFVVDVDDIRTVYWEAAVLCASVRMGSGTRNKVLHAMACGAPVVATSSALEGIAARHGEHLLVADDAVGLVRAVLETLEDRDAAARRAAAAARDVAATYTSAAAGVALETWWEKTAAVRRAPRPVAPRAAGAAPATATIIVRDVGGAEGLARCLKTVSVAASGLPGVGVVVVTGDAAAAGEACREAGLDASVVDGSGRGATLSRNAGARGSTAEVLLFTGGDHEVPPDWVKRHLEALADPTVAASFGPAGGIWRYDDADPFAAPIRHRSGSAPWMVGVGANAAVRRQVFERLGGFDERLGSRDAGGAAAEDADLIHRMLRSGAVLTSGVGDAVAPMGPPGEPHAGLVAAERAAGRWLGKALREKPRSAFPLLRARIGMLRDVRMYVRTSGDGRVPIREMAGAFGRGLASGLRLQARASVRARARRS